MIRVTKEKWNAISREHKGIWTKNTVYNELELHLPPNFIGKRYVLSCCICDQKGGLLTESIHFEIV